MQNIKIKTKDFCGEVNIVDNMLIRKMADCHAINFYICIYEGGMN